VLIKFQFARYKKAINIVSHKFYIFFSSLLRIFINIEYDFHTFKLASLKRTGEIITTHPYGKSVNQAKLLNSKLCQLSWG